MAELAPIPRPSDSALTAVTNGVRPSVRNASKRFRMRQCLEDGTTETPGGETYDTTASGGFSDAISPSRAYRWNPIVSTGRHP